MPKLFYFQAPTFTINPESETAPKLGSIFSNLHRLTGPLNQFDYVYVPSNLINKSSNADFNEIVKKGFAGTAGLNAAALQGLAGSASLIYTLAKDRHHVYTCELLETIEFEPNKQFIADCITASQNVQAFFENSLPGRKRVYMITGLKIATGFSTSTTKTTTHGPTLQVGVDGTALGVPAEAGPEFGLETNNARTVSQGRALNKIVFAYQVVKIKVKRDGEANYKYKSGGKYSVDDDDSDEEEDPWEIEFLDENSQDEYGNVVPVTIETVEAGSQANAPAE